MFLLPNIQLNTPKYFDSSIMVCEIFLHVLKSDLKSFATVFREVGLLNALTTCLQDFIADKRTSAQTS